MKLVIFAGGIGSRLWPLSRENTPKQFDQIFDGKSTIQLAVERVVSAFGRENIYIQTVSRYEQLIKDQVPDLPLENIIIEPARRDLGPAVCYAILELAKRDYDGPMTILWADHLMERVEEFVGALEAAKKLIQENGNRFIFLGERPRFANNNLGWIRVNLKKGNINGRDYYGFAGWKYRPETKECDQMHRSGEYYWNPGYFVTSVRFLIDQYKLLAPNIYKNVLAGRYEEAEALHFDKAIIEKVDLSDALVIKTNMGWSDPGTLYALKEALEESGNSNVTNGKVSCLNTSDSLIYNFQENKIVAAVGLRGMVVVNTKDALVVVPKEEVVNISKLIEQMREEGHHEYL